MEPLSIFTLTLTIFNIFINTIPAISEKGDQFRNFKTRIFQYYGILRLAKIKFEQWSALWGHTNDSDIQFYRTLFGDNAWAEITRRKESVDEQVRKLESKLCLKYEQQSKVKSDEPKETWNVFKRGRRAFAKPPTDENSDTKTQEEWKGATDDLIKSSAPDLKTDLVRRVLGILGRAKLLDELVKSTSTEVDILTQITSLHFERSKYGSGQSAEREALRAAENHAGFFQLAQSCRSYAPIYGNTPDDQPKHGWFLQLHMIEQTESKEVMRQILTMHDLRFATTVPSPEQNHLSKEVRSSRLAQPQVLDCPELSEGSFSYSYDNDEYYFKIKSTSYQFRQIQGPRIWTLNWKSLLELSESDEVADRVLVLQRARLAYSLTLWVVLLWGTTWLTRLCSCSLRCIIFSDKISSREAYKSRYQPIYSFCSNHDTPQFTNEPHDPLVLGQTQRLNYNIESATTCNVNETRVPHIPSKLYLLGILLAELILGKPIDPYKCNKNTVREQVQDSSSPAQHAVSFCLLMCDEPEWDEQRVELMPDQIARLFKDVVDPIRRHYDIVEGHAKQPKKERFTVRLPSDPKYWDKELTNISPSVRPGSS